MQKGNRNSCERQGTGHDGEIEGDTERLLQPHKVSGARTRKLAFIHLRIVHLPPISLHLSRANDPTT